MPINDRRNYGMYSTEEKPKVVLCPQVEMYVKPGRPCLYCEEVH